VSFRVLIEPSAIPIVVEVIPSAAHATDPGALEILETGVPDHAVHLDVGGLHIWYRLEAIPTGLVDLTVMYVEATARLFLGGQRLSCVVDVARAVVEHRFEHCLFWGFDRATRPGFVLETGELDCLFRGLDGRVLAQTAVDPPWERHVEAAGVRFESMVLGTTFLAFPDGPA